MDESKPTVRRLRLFALLVTSRRPRSRKELAELVARSPRTVGRDIEIDLTLSGFPVVVIVGKNHERYYTIDRGNPLPSWLKDILTACPCGGSDDVKARGHR